MTTTLLFQIKKERLLQRLLKRWCCSHYFDIKVDHNNNVTRVTCKISTLHLSQIQVEARERKLHGTVLPCLLKYADGLDSSQKENNDKHG